MSPSPALFRSIAHVYRSFSLPLPNRHEWSWLGNSNYLLSVNRWVVGHGRRGGRLRGRALARPAAARGLRRPEIDGVGGAAELQFLPVLPPLRQACAGPPALSRPLRAPASPPVRELRAGCTPCTPEARFCVTSLPGLYRRFAFLLSFNVAGAADCGVRFDLGVRGFFSSSSLPLLGRCRCNSMAACGIKQQG